MQILHWYERDRWIQRLQGCSPHLEQKPITIYPFPMDEILFQILKQSKLEEPIELHSQLQSLWEYYCNNNPDFIVTVKELISAGWLDDFFGRWWPIGHVKPEHIDAVQDGELKETLKFLCWIEKQIHSERSAVYVENWDGILADLRNIYPELPDTEWFIQQQILCEDQKHLCRFSYSLDRHHVHMALARLLLQMHTPEEWEQWAEIAHQLKATEGLMAYIPWQEQRKVVSLMVDRVLCGTALSVEQENNRIHRQYMLERKSFDKGMCLTDILQEDDSVHNIVRAEQSYWESFWWFWSRNTWRAFELAIILGHVQHVPQNKLEPLFARLKELHCLGLFDVQAPPPKACLDLLEYPQMQFLSLQTLAALHRECVNTNGNNAGNCILGWLTFAFQEVNFQDGEPIAHYLLYLAEYAYRGIPHNQPDTQLLQASLCVLSRYSSSKGEVLTALTEQLIASLSITEDVTWCRRFQLIVDWTEQLNQWLSVEQPEFRLLERLLDFLGGQLDDLINTPFCSKAAYLPPTVFEKVFWSEVYKRMNWVSQQKILNCVVCWYDGKAYTHQEQFSARYQFHLGLTLLTTLVQSLATDEMLILAFEFFLLYVLEEKNQILTIDQYSLWTKHGELARAIKTLQWQRIKDSDLFEKLQTLHIAELVILVQYVEDHDFRKFLMEVVEKKAESSSDCMERFGWDKIVEYVLQQKIQPLYPLCETRLEKHREYGRKKDLSHPIFDADWRQLSYLWFLRGDYEKVLSEGHPYMQAAVYMEEGNHRNLTQAIKIWRKIAEEKRDPGAYLNWMLAYLHQLIGVPVENRAERQYIYKNIDALRAKIENGPFQNWTEQDQFQYAWELISIWVEQGKSEHQAIKLVTQVLSLPEEKISAQWADSKCEAEETETIQLPPPSDPNTGQIEYALLRFRKMPLENKFKAYFGIDMPTHSGMPLVLLEVFRTLYHLSNFGDKLLSGKTLDEDHCTQLFREMFNLNGSEWWEIAANDQQQSGSTGTFSKDQLHRSAENDLLIKCGNYTYMIIEAMVMTNWDKNSVEKHLLKLIGDNVQNVPMVLLVYGNSQDPQSLWDKLCTYLDQNFSMAAETKGSNITSFSRFADSEFYFSDQYAPLQELVQHCVVAYVTHNGTGENGIPLFVICADIGKQAHMKISKAARV